MKNRDRSGMKNRDRSNLKNENVPNILTVTVNPAIDKMAAVRNFNAGHDHREEDICVTAGGKGINVSRAVKILGGATTATGFAGGAAGAYIRNMLDEEGIENDFYRISEETRTNLTIIDPARNKVTRVLERGPLVTLGEVRMFKRKCALLLRGRDYAVFSGSNANGAPPSLYRELIELAHGKGVRTALDTSGNPFVQGLGARPFLVKPNLEEAEAVVRSPLRSLRRIKKALGYFLDRGVRIVIISLGPEGAIASDGKEAVWAIPPRMHGAHSVGCGDALIGAFLCSYHRDGDLNESMRIAVAAGAARARAAGVNFFTRPALRKLAARIEVRDV